MKAGKMTARALAYALSSVGRKIAKERKAVHHGRQSVKQLMSHGSATSSIEIAGAPREFDRVARHWNVDYAFYKTEPNKYLLFFKSGQTDAITACFSEYSRRVLAKGRDRRIPIREQLERAEARAARERPRNRERVKEAARDDR